MDQIRTNIREIRKQKKLSQEMVGVKINISPSGYGKIERGQTELSLPRLIDIAQAFGVSSDYILNYHRGGETHESKDELIEFYEKIIILFRNTIEGIVYGKHGSIMNQFEGRPVSYEELLENDGAGLGYYEICEIPIRTKEDYENAPKLMWVNTQEEQYEGFKMMMKDGDIYSIFKLGLFNTNHFVKEWEQYQKENEEGWRMTKSRIEAEDVISGLKAIPEHNVYYPKSCVCP